MQEKRDARKGKREKRINSSSLTAGLESNFHHWNFASIAIYHNFLHQLLFWILITAYHPSFPCLVGQDFLYPLIPKLLTFLVQKLTSVLNQLPCGEVRSFFLYFNILVTLIILRRSFQEIYLWLSALH